MPTPPLTDDQLGSAVTADKPSADSAAHKQANPQPRQQFLAPGHASSPMVV